MDLLQELTESNRKVDNGREWVDAQAARQAVVKFITNNFTEFVKAYDQNSNIIRTEDGCYTTKKNYWGELLVPATDPLGYQVLDSKEDHKLVLRQGLPRIPAPLWAAWTALCFHYVENSIRSNLEVSVRILQNEEDETQFKIIVPRQEVTGASVRIKDFEDAVDILTGEQIECYPLPGWRSFGSSHSHNQMQAFASSIDDKYELGDPGLHVIVGAIKPAQMKYEIFASITSGKVRYKIPHDALIDVTPDHAKFHPNALEYVTVEKFKPYQYSAVPGWSATQYNKSWQNHQGKWIKDKSQQLGKTRYSPWSNPNHDLIDDYNDPFYWDANGQWNPSMLGDDDAEMDMERVKNAIDRIWDIYECYSKLEMKEVTDYIEQHLDFLTDQIEAEVSVEDGPVYVEIEEEEEGILI